MLILTGFVMTRHGIATDRLAPVQDLIAERIGLPSLYAGTLNLQLNAPYYVNADATIEQHEYDGLESLRLQRCRVKGMKCCIMRPSSHEKLVEASKVLEIMAPVRLRHEWGLEDGDTLDVEVEGDDAWWSA